MEPIAPALILLRGLHLAALCAGFGSLLAWRPLVLRRPVIAKPQRDPLLRMAQGALAAGLLTMLPWLALQAAAIAEVHTLSALPGALGVVLTQTWFGHVVVARAVLLAGALLLCRAGLPTLALLPAALALMSEAAIGHAVNGESAVLAAETLHLLAAGAWLGRCQRCWCCCAAPTPCWRRSVSPDWEWPRWRWWPAARWCSPPCRSAGWADCWARPMAR